MKNSVSIVEGDLQNTSHARAVVDLIDAYAGDLTGGGNSLSNEVLDRLVPALRRHPTSLVFLAYQGAEPVGIAVCFIGFSTFAAKPLVNVHDLAVVEHCRRQGVGRLLLERVEQKARQLGCSKLTLEVREDNPGAMRLYRSAGFGTSDLDADDVQKLFLAKLLEK